MYTIFQTNTPYSLQTDLGTDGVLVYVQQRPLSDHIMDTIYRFRENGYKVFGMISASHDYGCIYTNGGFDGIRHEDEVQRDRNGHPLMIGLHTYYMVPTIGWREYLTTFCQQAVDAGLDGIVLEEPEYWFRAGYSSAFQKAYDNIYGIGAHRQIEDNKAGFLKAQMYFECLSGVIRDTKDYAASCGKVFKVYIAEHSLINYASWHITCPTAKFAQIPELDGIIGQVWTGTARCPKTCYGKTQEYIFETAFLEYSFFDQLAAVKDKEYFLLTDPVEDAVDYNTRYTWDDYRTWYTDTLVASLMQRHVTRYEVMPWPHRVFCEPLKNGARDQMGWQELYTAYRTANPDVQEGQESAIAAFERYLSNFYNRDVTFGDYSVDLFRQFKAEIGWEQEKADSLEKTVTKMAAFAWRDGPKIPSSYTEFLRFMQGVQQRMHEWPSDISTVRGRAAILIGDSAMYCLETSSEPVFTQNIPTVKNADVLFFSIALPLLQSGYLIEVLAEEALPGEADRNDLPDFLVVPLDCFFCDTATVLPFLLDFSEKGGHLVIAGCMERIQQLESKGPDLFKRSVKVIETTPLSLENMERQENPFVAFANACCPDEKYGTSLMVRRGPYVVGRQYSESCILPGQYLDLLRDTPVIYDDVLPANEAPFLLKRLDRTAASCLIEASAGVKLLEEATGYVLLESSGPIGTRNGIYLYLASSRMPIIQGIPSEGVAYRTDPSGTIAKVTWPNSEKSVRIQINF